MKSVKNPWSFAAPDYDKRSSNAVNAGTHQGVGKVNPVGHEGAPKQDVPALPRGKMSTMRDDEKG